MNQETNTKFTLAEIADEGMKRFRLKPGEVGQRVRKRIELYVKKEKTKEGKTLWEASEDHNYDKANKKNYHFFTKEQKSRILGSPEIYDYLTQLKESSGQKNVIPRIGDLEAKAKETNDNYEIFRKENCLPPGPYMGDFPSDEYIVGKETQIMVKALFDLFFEPLDTKFLHGDFENKFYYGGNTETAETLESKYRLENELIYCSRKSTNDILDDFNINIEKKFNIIMEKLKQLEESINKNIR